MKLPRFDRFQPAHLPLSTLPELPIGRPNIIAYQSQIDQHSQALFWYQLRRAVAKVEWQLDELFRRVGFIMKNVVEFHIRCGPRSYVTFQVAEVAVMRKLFAMILEGTRRSRRHTGRLWMPCIDASVGHNPGCLENGSHTTSTRARPVASPVGTQGGRNRKVVVTRGKM